MKIGHSYINFLKLSVKIFIFLLVLILTTALSSFAEKDLPFHIKLTLIAHKNEWKILSEELSSINEVELHFSDGQKRHKTGENIEELYAMGFKNIIKNSTLGIFLGLRRHKEPVDRSYYIDNNAFLESQKLKNYLVNEEFEVTKQQDIDNKTFVFLVIFIFIGIPMISLLAFSISQHIKTKNSNNQTIDNQIDNRTVDNQTEQTLQNTIATSLPNIMKEDIIIEDKIGNRKINIK